VSGEIIYAKASIKTTILREIYDFRIDFLAAIFNTMSSYTTADADTEDVDILCFQEVGFVLCR